VFKKVAEIPYASALVRNNNVGDFSYFFEHPVVIEDRMSVNQTG